MRKLVKVFTVLVFAAIIAICFSGCEVREAKRVSYNISKQADNFNVTRRLTVINTRTDTITLQMIGKMSIEDVTDGIEVLVELDRKKGIYQKHYVYLNRDTTYTVEDVSGTNVSRYAYEMEFMPQTIIPVKITADEIEQDIADVYAGYEEDADDE